MERNVQFSIQDITDSDIADVSSVLRSGWLAHGKYSEKFEELFREFTDSKYAITVSNCTAGLHISCLAAGFGPGDEVIVPAQTHTATSHAVEFTGAQAVFADVDPLSANITLSEIKEKITNSTKGIIPVHMAGYPCDMAEIKEFCDDNNLILIEDCAHGLGSYISDKHVGNFGLCGNFSFYPTKQVTTGEGGMIICNDKEFFEKVTKLKAFGIDTPPELRGKPGIYDVSELGYNYRMTDFQAALGAGQMSRYESNLLRRKKNAKLYSTLLSELDEITYLPYSDNNSYFLFQILLSDSIDRDDFLSCLKGNGIGFSIHYATPVPLMSYYRKKYNFKSEQFPNAFNYGLQSVSLPVHPKLNESDIVYVCETVKKYISSKSL